MRRALPLLAALLCLAPATARAQATEPLEPFVQLVARLWAAGRTDGLVELAPGEGQILLDTGNGSAALNPRHAIAALRSLFGERHSVAVRAGRVTISGGRPPRGFGEFEWTFRARGTPITQKRSVFVSAVWTGRGWSLSEIRILP